MKLVKIADLVGVDTSGMKFDLRTRNAAGKCDYSHQDTEIPGTITKVVIKHERIQPHRKETPKVPWLYWYTTGAKCNFSGKTLDTCDDTFLLQLN